MATLTTTRYPWPNLRSVAVHQDREGGWRSVCEDRDLDGCISVREEWYPSARTQKEAVALATGTWKVRLSRVEVRDQYGSVVRAARAAKPARYRLYEMGPDDDSTYPECWGSQARSLGRLIAEADGRRELAARPDARDVMTRHENWVVYDRVEKARLLPHDFRGRVA